MVGHNLNIACQRPIGRVVTDLSDGDECLSDELRVTQASYIGGQVDAARPSTRQLSRAGGNIRSYDTGSWCDGL
ncbi:MAG: hypothetical protein BAJATHORv1_20583 [Candidatus Thorarchaeota archaeon]|nr:MAG: hypothetical protein BAJATHORv1_20583 [Candidatus Thorarchaeota archaeon]